MGPRYPRQMPRTRVVCRHCGKENIDPGGDLRRWRCWNCAFPGQLLRAALSTDGPAGVVLLSARGVWKVLRPCVILRAPILEDDPR